jgi:hypothetical protein
MQQAKWLETRLVAGFHPRRPGLEPRSGHVGFVVDKVALGQVLSEYFGFLCQLSFHRLLHIYHHLSSGAGLIGQLVADVQSSHPTLRNKKKKKKNPARAWADHFTSLVLSSRGRGFSWYSASTQRQLHSFPLIACCLTTLCHLQKLRNEIMGWLRLLTVNWNGMAMLRLWTIST